MGRSGRWLMGIALVGTLASVVAAGMLWVALTRPEALATTLGVWLKVAR